jgi:arylsulfatase A-like enzyme
MTMTPTWRVLAAVTAGLLAAPAAAADRKPNVVVVFIDDMGPADLGCYGGQLAPTPHCDSLARNGVRFTCGYSSACVCSPARVGLLTGRYQARTGHDANTTRPGTELDLNEVTIAQWLKAAGYATGVVGKWHLGEGKEYLPGARGFDFGYGSTDNLAAKKGTADFYRGSELVRPPEEYPITSPLYAKEACGFVERHKDRPFFLYLAFNAVHAPRVASEATLKRFAHLPRRQQHYAACLAECDEAVGKADPAEAKDLSAEQPAKAKALLALWEGWNEGNKPPRWTDRRWDGEEARKKDGDPGP